MARSWSRVAVWRSWSAPSRVANQELAELPASVALVALPDDLSGGDVEGCEQRGRAVALVVMGAPLDPAGAQRQQGLGAIERLNLGRLVHAEDHGVLRRVHVQAYDVARLVHEVGVRRELEEVSLRCGCSENACQIRWIVDGA